jgi:hypothetical protein
MTHIDRNAPWFRNGATLSIIWAEQRRPSRLC